MSEVVSYTEQDQIMSLFTNSVPDELDLSTLELPRACMASLEDTYDSTLADLGMQDAMDVRFVITDVTAGNLTSATTQYRNLDTIVRDQFPAWFAELAGSNISVEDHEPGTTFAEMFPGVV